jgi:hypothetical protein
MRLGVIYNVMKKRDEAIKALKKSLEIREKIFGRGHKNCEENRRILEVEFFLDET